MTRAVNPIVRIVKAGLKYFEGFLTFPPECPSDTLAMKLMVTKPIPPKARACMPTNFDIPRRELRPKSKNPKLIEQKPRYSPQSRGFFHIPKVCH